MKNAKSRRQWLFLMATAILLAVVIRYYISLFTPPGEDATPVIVEFPQGVSFYQIAKSLEEKGIIRNFEDFTFLAKLRGSTKKIRAGEYEFSLAMRAYDVLVKMEKGLVVKRPVTIPEGFNIREIADLLEKKGVSQRDRFIAMANDKGFLLSIGLEGTSAEGFLFPDTYQFFKGMTEEAMISTMVSQFKEVFTDELTMKTREAGLSMMEVVTLASIVEKETGAAEERPRIAGVFMNRLRKKIPLQSDPTVIYGIKEFNGNLTRKDLMTETPYNTYRIKGLPAGPISNPGIDSIKAVLYPEKVDYVYFVSKKDGTHHFSKTLSEHNRAVRQYQISASRGNK